MGAGGGGRGENKRKRTALLTALIVNARIKRAPAMKLLLNDRACNTMNNWEDAVICCRCNLRNSKLLMHNSANFGCSEPMRAE